MRLKYNFIVREVAGQSVALAVGEDAANFNGMIKLNSVGEFIFKLLAEETTFEQIISTLTTEYDVTVQVAADSLLEYLNILRDNNLLIE